MENDKHKRFDFRHGTKRDYNDYNEDTSSGSTDKSIESIDMGGATIPNTSSSPNTSPPGTHTPEETIPMKRKKAVRLIRTSYRWVVFLCQTLAHPQVK